MELLDNYNKALKALFDHISFKERGEGFPIVDCSEFKWKLEPEMVKYGDNLEYTGYFVKKKVYSTRVFGGIKITGILTGLALGTESLQIFDNSKYVGNAKQEKAYI